MFFDCPCFTGQDVNWDDFLPALSYVIVECNRPHLLIEVEYMMELLEPSWLGGEGTIKLLWPPVKYLVVFFFFISNFFSEYYVTKSVPLDTFR